jgi:hypothetical protein
METHLRMPVQGEGYVRVDDTARCSVGVCRGREQGLLGEIAGGVLVARPKSQGIALGE